MVNENAWVDKPDDDFTGIIGAASMEMGVTRMRVHDTVPTFDIDIGVLPIADFWIGAAVPGVHHKRIDIKTTGNTPVVLSDLSCTPGGSRNFGDSTLVYQESNRFFY